MKRILFFLGCLSLLITTDIVHATFVEVEEIPSTGTETMTIGTESIPYIDSIVLSSSTNLLKAGNIATFTTQVFLSTGVESFDCKKEYNCKLGSITVNGEYTAIKAGADTIQVIVDNNRIATVEVIVIPNDMKNIALQIQESPVIYGKVYDKNLFTVKGYDLWGNEIVIDKLQYLVAKKEGKSRLSERVKTSSSQLMQIIENGVIFYDNQILFFDVGTYEITVVVNEKLQSIFTFNSIFGKYATVIAWEDYHLKKMNFDTGRYEVQYTFTEFPAITVESIINPEKLIQFKEGNYLQKLKVLTDTHYEILSKRQELFEEKEYDLFKSLFEIN